MSPSFLCTNIHIDILAYWYFWLFMYWFALIKLISILIKKHNRRISPHLSRIWPLCALHGHSLRSGAWICLLGHPLAVGSERPHSRCPGLVHAHWRAADIGVVYASTNASWVHASCHGRWAPGSRLVHKLAVITLRRAHLKRWAHLEKTNITITYPVTYPFGLLNVAHNNFQSNYCL